jgi:hypothetical protein
MIWICVEMKVCIHIPGQFPVAQGGSRVEFRKYFQASKAAAKECTVFLLAASNGLGAVLEPAKGQTTAPRFLRTVPMPDVALRGGLLGEG